MGEDAGGGGDGFSPPHPNLPPPGGKGHNPMGDVVQQHLWVRTILKGEVVKGIV